MNRTTKLTGAEIAQIDKLPNFGEIQQETLALRKRSGVRYGTNVGGGTWNIVTVAYALDKKGRPFGASTANVIVGGLAQADVVNALRAL